jgi:hypothetical protein
LGGEFLGNILGHIKKCHRKPPQETVGVYNVWSSMKNMSKDMTGKEKLLFIASFIWAMHWGVRLTFAAFSTLELKYF